MTNETPAPTFLPRRPPRAALALAALALAIAGTVPAGAFTLNRDTAGTTVALRAAQPWDGPRPHLALAGNPANLGGVGDEAFRGAVVRSLQRWQRASDDAFGFHYWQGRDPEIYEPSLLENGLSSVFFASAVQDPADVEGAPLDATTAAYTRVWYDLETGAVLEADIVLNDRHFTFTDDPALVTYDEGGWLGHVVLLDDVLAHEIGHALGLGHSSVSHATMVPRPWFGQAGPGADDRAGLRALFGVASAGDPLEDPSAVASDLEPVGELRGSIEAPDGGPLFAARVTLIDAVDGTVRASVLTEPDGSWALDDVPPGALFVMAGPHRGEADELPAFYGALDHHVCPDGQRFARTFLTHDGGATPVTVRVWGGRRTTAPALRVACTADGGAAVTGQPVSASAGGVPILDDGGPVSFAALERIVPGPDERAFLLRDVEGAFVLEVVGHSLSSAGWIRASLTTLEGAPLASVAVDPSRCNDAATGFFEWDTRLWAALPQRGDYLLWLEAGALAETLYPGGAAERDPTSFALLIARPAERSAPPWYDDPSVCPAVEMDLPQYVSPSGLPARRALDDPAVGCAIGRTAAANPAVALAVPLALVALAARRRRGSPARAPARRPGSERR